MPFALDQITQAAIDINMAGDMAGSEVADGQPRPEGRPGSATAFTAPLSVGLPPYVPWAQVQPLLHSFWLLVEGRVERRHRAGRLKQWLNLLRRRYPEAQTAFDELRTTNDADALSAWLLLQSPSL